MTGYCSLPGEHVSGGDLRIEKAHALWNYLATGKHPYARFISAQRYENGTEAIVFDVDVELAQVRHHDILPAERLATAFGPADDYVPETVALRNDFPLVPHVNPTAQEFPRSLCLYEEPYDELRLRWTPASHIERARTWLSDNAAGNLHRDDQPVEQIFLGGLAPIILPWDFGRDGPDEPLYVSYGQRSNEQFIFIGERQPKAGHNPAFPVVLTAPPTINQRVRTIPTNLQSLDLLLREFGFSLVAELTNKLRSAQPEARNRACVFIVHFPRVRVAGGTIERYETWAFATLTSVEEIGEALGLWQRSGQFVGTLLAQAADDEALTNINVFVLNPLHSLSRETAAIFNNGSASTKRIAAIGVGTLGSRVLMNCVRTGYGEWAIIDSDFLSPHNVARHELTSRDVPSEKATALAFRANAVFDGAVTRTESIDVLRPGSKKADQDAILSNCDAICDMSASVAVARQLANDEALTARRASLFLNPRGDSLVLLCEDERRHIRLDDLEMQYYAYLAATPAMHDHLAVPPEAIRYARSCRDVSSRISNDDVSVCAALGSRLLRQALSKPTAVANILTVAGVTVTPFEIPLCHFTSTKVGRWRLRYSENARAKMQQHRRSRLPNETGGVLIGAIDYSRHLIYVAEAIGSPLDSEEYPTSYIRGVAGLSDSVNQVRTVTDGQLRYLGEWHSHPDGYSTNPSSDDKTLFLWLAEHLAKDGSPPVMCICGESRERWFVDRMQ